MTIMTVFGVLESPVRPMPRWAGVACSVRAHWFPEKRRTSW